MPRKKTLYRRGFKAESDAYSRAYRDELGLAHHDPLCPWKLAKHLAIPVIPLSNFSSVLAEECILLSTEHQTEFFAVTVFDGFRRTIVHNDSVSKARQAADIAHELAHGILFHEPHELHDGSGERVFDEVMEAEANWLGPALLISKEAALYIVEQNMTTAEAARLYGVSSDVVNMRTRATGARKRIENRRKRDQFR